MIQKIIIGVVALAVVAVGAFFGVRYLQDRNAPPSPTPEETEVVIGDIEDTELEEADLGDLGAPAEPVEGDMAAAPEEDTAAPVEDIELDGATPEEDIAIEPPEMSGDALGATGSRAIAEVEPSTEKPREKRPADTQPATRPATQPSEAPEIEVPEEPTSAPEEAISPEAEPTATPAPVAAPAQGDYNVRTIEPVFKSELAAVRKAMQSLGVQLQEQQTGQKQISAYKIAVGYFRTKAEAESWARYNFRPRSIDYYIYPVQGMFSIQVGVYAQQKNVEPAMRQLYKKYQGGRLPVRTETTTITKSAYHLSISNITESLAERIWNKLNRLGIQAELSRA